MKIVVGLVVRLRPGPSLAGLIFPRRSLLVEPINQWRVFGGVASLVPGTIVLGSAVKDLKVRLSHLPVPPLNLLLDSVGSWRVSMMRIKFMRGWSLCRPASGKSIMVIWQNNLHYMCCASSSVVWVACSILSGWSLLTAWFDCQCAVGFVVRCPAGDTRTLSKFIIIIYLKTWKLRVSS